MIIPDLFLMDVVAHGSRQLLSHSAGLGYDMNNLMLARYHGGSPLGFCGDFVRLQTIEA